MRFAAVSLLALFFSIPARASAIEELKSFVDSTHAARAQFTQTVLDRNLRVVQKASGTMEFMRPGKFRWVYDKPYQQLIVGDGKKIWIYDQDLNQVTVRKLTAALGQSPAALLAGDNEIEKRFTLSELGQRQGLDWVEAVPKEKEGSFQQVRLGFDKNSVLAAMELKDSFGQTTVLRFSKLERNPALAPGLFQFAPPAGADVISD